MELCLIEFTPGVVSVCKSVDEKTKVAEVYEKWQDLDPERAARIIATISLGLYKLDSVKTVQRKCPTAIDLNLMNFGEALEVIERGAKVKANWGFCAKGKWESIGMEKTEGCYQVVASYIMSGNQDFLAMQTASVDNMLLFLYETFEIARELYTWQEVK
jgi:alpha-glucuronidase